MNSLINGEQGSIVGKMDAYFNLRNGIEAYTEQWWAAIRQIIGDFPVTMEVITDKGPKTAEVILSMMPDGKTINYNHIIKQIENQVGSFIKNLQDFANMTAAVYKMLADAGFISYGDIKNMVWSNMEHKHLTRQNLITYYSTLPASHPWKKAHKDANEYADFVSSPNATIQFGGHTWQSGKERVYIRKQMTNRAVNRTVTANNQVKDKANQLTGNTPKTDTKSSGTTTTYKSPATTTSPSTTPSAGRQDAYASHYDKSAARPTVVNINIGELAHFDRTSVAGSAQERDLMTAMEEKITEAIYRLSMTALNNVGGYMS